MRLHNKTAIVTGGNIGIGRGIALALARCGAQVAITYLSHANEAKQTAREIGEVHPDAQAGALRQRHEPVLLHGVLPAGHLVEQVLILCLPFLNQEVAAAHHGVE